MFTLSGCKRSISNKIRWCPCYVRRISRQLSSMESLLFPRRQATIEKEAIEALCTHMHTKARTAWTAIGPARSIFRYRPLRRTAFGQQNLVRMKSELSKLSRKDYAVRAAGRWLPPLLQLVLLPPLLHRSRFEFPFSKKLVIDWGMRSGSISQ